MVFFQKLINSITKPSEYPKMVEQGIGKAIVYLVLFSLLFGTLNSIIIGFQLHKDIGVLISGLNKHIPQFTFEDGELDVKEPMPIIYEIPDSGVLIIDTTGETTPKVLTEYPMATLILKDRLINKSSELETHEYYFSDFQGVSFDRQDVIEFLPYIKWFSVIAGIFIWFAFILGKFISSLLLTLLNLIISSIRKGNLSFSKLYSLSIYSLTLPVLLDLVLQLFNVDLPNLIYYIIALIYGWLAIGSITKRNRDEIVIEE